ncbi:tubulin-like doman-containing protein [Actinoplanes sp. NPDC049265]|uniref:tubulin-like doman-containing protein n=1 Tax=Actinoplanes sp. NPDC049265 TaxID=3363902 RepID=UPI00371C1DB2
MNNVQLPMKKIHQPMMFVGLGGTGCKVGAELEKRLREGLCGPDGTALQARMPDRGLLPYQLPACTQFVYADLSAAELQRVRREVVPGREHEHAAQKTMRLITDLVPAGLGNSAEVAQSLRINLDEETIGWLPPRDSDPRVGPLLRGAGQLPTVGRAVLFETLRRNRDTALAGLREALSDINKSAGDLMAISGQPQRLDTVLVFVVFSVAGGTGSGIFYDYLHLIGDMMERGGKHAEIYPLVLMPSAFDEIQGGGRPADLNAGSSLIELFRLIDDQNARGGIETIGAESTHRTVSVHYPAAEVVQLPPSMIQTAFLFGRPVGGVRRDDLHRSMVSLMDSLLSAEPPDAQSSGLNASYMTFADDFINKAVERNPMSDTGVGRRGVTTSAVAALTTPLAEITDIVSGHLLANAVEELTKPPGAAESNKTHIRNFIAAAGLDTLLEAKPSRIPPYQNPAGLPAVLNTLTERANAMAANIERGQDSLAMPIAEMAQKIQPAAATKVLLRDIDLFRVRRVVFGHPELPDAVDRGGFRSLLENWLKPPPAPPGLNAASPPQAGNLRRRITHRMRMTDPEVQQVVRKQDNWYAWQTRRLYNAAWNDSRRLWERPWQGYVDEMVAVHEQFQQHARDDRQQFDARCKDLYKARVGVAYLLPAEDNGLGGFYRTVLDRMKQQYSQQLPANPHEGHVLNALLGADGWLAAYQAGRHDPLEAVGYVRQRIKQAVTEQLRPPTGDRPALIPRMEDLLSSAAVGRSRSITDDDLNRFRQKLAELVPGGFAPDGRAPFKTLFTYPAAQENRDIERFLRREVALPIDMQGEPEFRAVPGESMVVVLLRSAMGVTEVPEVRRVVKLWVDAQRSPRPNDYLTWRRRLKPDAGYRLMSREDRRFVLHHLLCAAWDGRIEAHGDLSSPHRIEIRLGAEEASTMTLKLSALGTLSSWSSVLQAYEQWILNDDDRGRRDLAAKLMSHSPDDADRTPRRPEPEFLALVDLIELEAKKLKEAEEHRVLSRDPHLAVIREFWLESMPAALSLPVGTSDRSLLELREQVDAAYGLGQ